MNISVVVQSPERNIDLDVASILIGIVVGILLVVLVRWLWPKILANWKSVGRSLSLKREMLQSGAETRYKNEVAASVQRHHLGSGSASLADIFVPPRISVLHSNDDSYPLRMEASQMHNLWPGLAAEIALSPPPSVTLRQLLMNGKRVMLSSDPGTGKTTLLAYCASLCARSSSEVEFAFLEAKVPVFVHVIELGLFGGPRTGETDQAETPLRPILIALAGRYDNISQRKLRSLIHMKAEQGQMLLLLDGWDELSAADRLIITNWLSKLFEIFPDTQAVIAGPTRGFGPLIHLDFIVAGMMAWRKGQAISLGSQWTRVTETPDDIPVDHYWRPGNTSFESSTRVILLAGAGEKNGSEIQPPLRKVDVLETTLLSILRKIRLDSSEEWLAPAIRELWQGMAFAMLSDRRLFLLKSEVTALAEPILSSYSVANSTKASKRLFRILSDNELFVHYQGDLVSFLSPLWRDYLAASYLAQADAEASVIDYLGDPFWLGALRFYAGRVGAVNLLRVIQQEDASISDNDLFLLAGWLPESLDRKQWRRQILIGLGRIVIDQDIPVFWRQRATAALTVTGEQGVSALLNQLLSQPEPLMRQVALAAMARVTSREAIVLNERMAGDSDERVRVAAIHALAWMDDPEAEEPLIRGLLEPDESISKAAAEGLALNGTAKSRQILTEAIVDDSMSVRKAAVHGLALLEEDWANDLLKEVAQVDNQRFIQSAASRALQTGKMEVDSSVWQAPKAGEQEWLIDWAVTRGRVVPVGPAAIPLVIEALDNGDDHTRESAAKTLAGIMTTEAVVPLQKALADPQADVRAAAFYALCLIDRAWENDAIPMLQA